MQAVGWRAWYESPDDPFYVVFTSKEGDTKPGTTHVAFWDNLPREGCLAVVVYFDEVAPDGRPLRRVCTDSKFFKFSAPDGNWTIGHNNSSDDSIAEKYGIVAEKIKRGKWTSEAIMEAVRIDSMESREF